MTKPSDLRRSLVLAFALCATSCASGTASKGPEDTKIASAAGQAELPTLPSQWFADTQQDLQDLSHDLPNFEIEACMKSAGFEYQWPRLLGRTPWPMIVGRFGQALPRTPPHTRYRDGLPDEQFPTPTTQPNEAAEKAFSLALSGPENEWVDHDVVSEGGTQIVTLVGGCSGKAIATVFGSNDAFLSFVEATAKAQDFSNDSVTYVAASSAFHQLELDWSECMSSAGEARFASPQEAFSFDFSTTSPDDEVRVYALDLACQSQTSFTLSAQRLEAEWQGDHLTNQEQAVEELKGVYAGMQSLAKSVELS